MTKKRTTHIDYRLLGIVGALFVCGLVMLFSASTVESYKNFSNTTYYFTHQLLYGGLTGLVALYICSRIDYHVWQKLLPILLGVAIICLFLVKVPGIGFSANGATRWIHFGPIVFQPAEIAKLVIIIYLAAWIARKNTVLKHFYLDIVPALAIIGLFAALILWQPDLGTTMVLVGTGVIMLFVGGIRLRYLAGIGGIGLLLLFLLIKFEPYRARRLTTFLDPSHDRLGIGYHINQALIAIGSGGLFGYGYGGSRQKHNYLPEALSDSVFAVIAEEMGLLRSSFILVLFVLFGIRGVQISLRAPDLFGKMLGVGLTTAIIVQTIINLGAILGLLPLTGVPLPFFSYGSSSLIITLASVGILLNISRQSQIPKYAS